MDMKSIVGFVYMMLGFGSMYVPRLLLRYSPKYFPGGLRESFPDKNWVPFAYPVLLILWMLLAIFGLFFGFRTTEFGFAIAPDKSYFNMGMLLASIAIFNGLFALISGVFPLQSRRNPQYVVDDNVTQTGFLSIGAGVLYIMAGILAVFFW